MDLPRGCHRQALDVLRWMHAPGLCRAISGGRTGKKLWGGASFLLAVQAQGEHGWVWRCLWIKWAATDMSDVSVECTRTT